MRSFRIFRMVASGLVLAVGGCGPLQHPMFTRLSPDAQAEANASWNNMLSPPSRLDKQTLLEVVIEHQFYELGVTRGTFHTEKAFAGGDGGDGYCV